MNVYLTQLREWFLALAPRERVMVAVAAVFSVFTLLYLGLWEPLANAHYKRAEALKASRALASRLEVIAAEAARHGGAGGGSAANRSLSLLAAVDQSSKLGGTLGKPPSRLQPEGDNEVKVWIEAANFDALVRWIAELETRYGVSAQTVDIDKESAPGSVNARLTLVRP